VDQELRLQFQEHQQDMLEEEVVVQEFVVLLQIVVSSLMVDHLPQEQHKTQH
jgi:hypothetical protein